MKTSRSKYKLLALLIFTVSLVACGGLEQDPLKGESDRIRKAVGEDDIPQRKPTIPRGAMQIDIEPRVANFTEGEEGKLKITGRVFNVKVDSEVVIEKEDLPEGATFDSATGEFIWTPPYETVYGDNFHQIIEMKVRLYAYGKEPVAIERLVPINVRVASAESPEVVSYKLAGATNLAEGGAAVLEVVVRDRSAIDGTVLSNTGPSFSVIPIYDDERNAASFVRNTQPNRSATRNSNDPSLWTFYLKINLGNRDVISRKRDMGFGLIVYSRFGVPSKVENINFEVENRVIDPELSWGSDSKERPVFVVGEKQRYVFKAFDRRDEAEVNVSDLQSVCSRSLSSKAKCECINPIAAFTDDGVSCFIEWEPTKDDVGTRILNIQASATNRENPLDVQRARFTRSVSIIEQNKKVQ